MKTKKVLLSIFLLCSIFLSNTFGLYAQAITASQIAAYPVSSWAVALADDTSVKDIKKYYPVTPSSPDWKLFTTSEEMIKACQIKPDLLAKMTTEEVVEAVLSYPLLGDIFYFNTVGAALQNLLQKSDAYRELVTRSDAMSCLLDRYDEIMQNIINI